MMMMMEGGEESPPPLQTEQLTCQRKKKDKNSRRFSDEQISCLESMFKMETKLEPRKKLQLARELGLQPRQVAIWFQNRRARWKSKQIEQEYRLLKSNYDNLSSRFDSLKDEKQSLLIQLQKLRGQLKNRDNEGRESKDVEDNSTDDSGSENGKKICELEENPSCLRERLGGDVVVYSDEGDYLRNSRFPAQGGEEEEEEAELMKLGEQVDLSLVPPERWCNFETGGLFDHTCNGTLNWWDFST